MRSFNGHSGEVRAVTFTPDGRVVSGGADKTVRVWDSATGACTAVVKAKGPVYAVAVSPDGATVAYGGRAAPRAESNFAYLCDPAGKPTGKCEVRTQEEFLEYVPGSFEARTVRRWMARSIWSLAFSADGRYLAAACRRPGGGNIPNGGGGRVWHRSATGDDAHLPDDVYALAFAPTGCRLAITRNQQVAFHDDPAGPETVSYPTTASWSASVAFIPGAVTNLAVVASGAFLYFMNPAREEKPTRVKTGFRGLTAVAVSPDGRTILAGGLPGAVEVYDAATRAKTTTYDFGVGGVHALAFAPDGLTFAAAGYEGLVVCDAAG